MRTRIALIVAAAGLAAAVPQAAHAQVTAARIAEQAAQRWEQRLRDVRNFTVTQSAVGAEMVIYAERAPGSTAAAPAWRSKAWVRQANGTLTPARTAAAPFAAAQSRLFRDNAARFRFVDTRMLEGKQVHVLTLTGAAATADVVPGMPLGGSAAERSGAQATYFIDAAELVPLRVELTMGSGGGPNAFKIVLAFSDYRSTGGLLLPYRTSLAPEGQESSGALQITLRDVKVNTGPPATTGAWH
jgi:hypothetical protein